MHKSKIARLPAALQDELNERLSNNDNEEAILAWLNGLPSVQTMLTERFQSQPINPENLLLWRKTGLPAWINRHERLECLRELERFAGQYAKTNHATLVDGVAALAHARLLELLELVDDDAAAEAPDPETGGGDPGQPAAGTTTEGAEKPVSNESRRKLAADQLAKIVATLRALRGMEHDRERLKQNEKRIELANQKLVLQRDDIQREAVSFGLRVLHDARAKEINDDPAVSYEQRIEILGTHIFGDLWIPRNIPGVASLSPEQVAALRATAASRVPAESATPKADGGLKMGDGQNQAQAEKQEDPTRPKAGGLN